MSNFSPDQIETLAALIQLSKIGNKFETYEVNNARKVRWPKTLVGPAEYYLVNTANALRSLIKDAFVLKEGIYWKLTFNVRKKRTKTAKLTSLKKEQKMTEELNYENIKKMTTDSLNRGYVIKTEDRPAFIDAVIKNYLLPVLEKKGRDYTAYDKKEDQSANSNFGNIANMLNNPSITKYTVWSIFFLKHVTSILSWISTEKLESEKMEGRLTDLINYLFIYWSMQVEDGLLPHPTDMYPITQ